MKFTLLEDKNLEIVLKLIINECKEDDRANVGVIIRHLEKDWESGREDFRRIIAYLCKLGYLKCEKVRHNIPKYNPGSKTPNFYSGPVTSTAYELTYEGMHYFENKEKYFKEQRTKLKEANDDSKQEEKNLKGTASGMKKPKLFISHSTKDIAYVTVIVELLENIGLTNKEIFCSSVPGYGVPLGQDIYEYLRDQFGYNLHVIFILSNNYYESPASLNEMGAAWVVQNVSTNILLPGFTFEEIKGVANRNKVAITLDGSIDELKYRLREFQENITNGFNMQPILPEKWERKRDEFLYKIQQIR